MERTSGQTQKLPLTYSSITDYSISVDRQTTNQDPAWVTVSKCRRHSCAWSPDGVGNSGPHGFEPVTTRHRAGDTDIVIASCMVLDFTKQLSPTAPTADFVVWMFTSVCVQLFKSLLCEGEGIQTEWAGTTY